MKTATVAGTPGPAKSIFIATETRSGSNFLCAMMKSTGCMGDPGEYFSKYVAFDNAETAQERYVYACKNSITPNGIISVKIFPEHWEMIDGQFNIKAAFPDLHWIWLRRRDLLAQAISRYIAIQTRAWVSSNNPGKTPEYSGSGILTRLRYLANSESRWRIFFTRNSINPLTIYYEDMVMAPEKTVMEIASYIGIDIDPGRIGSDVHTRSQRTSLNEEWKNRFLDEMADLDYMDISTRSRKYNFSLENLVLLIRGRLKSP